MNLKKFGNFNWIEMDSKDQNLDLTRTKRIHFSPFQSVFIWVTHIFNIHNIFRHKVLTNYNI